MMSPYPPDHEKCKSGVRFNSEVSIRLDAKLMMQEGLTLMKTIEGTICCEARIDPRYFTRIEYTKGKQVIYERPVSKDGLPELSPLLRNLRVRNDEDAVPHRPVVLKGRKAFLREDEGEEEAHQKVILRDRQACERMKQARSSRRVALEEKGCS